MAVLLLRIEPENLREVLHVDGLTTAAAVEALHGESFAFHSARIFGKAADIADFYELGARNLDTYGAREGHHGVFVFRYGGKAARRQFDDPGTAHAAGRNGQPPRGFHHPGKLELYARK